MSSIQYLTGDATSPQAKGNKLICHICNDLGHWGKGFVLAISKKWIEPERDYRHWHRQGLKNDFALGNVRFIDVGNGIFVGNMLAQRGIKTSSNGSPIRYAALRCCLAKVAVKAADIGASVHMPRIGCGLAGGQWEKIEPIIVEELLCKGLEVTIYDFQ